MASSRLCTIEKCKRLARALCDCCQQRVCIRHLKEHSDVMNNHLVPLVDEINELFEQFNNASSPQSGFLIELNNWREEAHRTIDYFCERKIQEFEELRQNEQKKQKNEIDQLRNEIDQLIREQETTREQIDSINYSIRSLQEQIDRSQQPPILSSLILDDNLVDIYKNSSKLVDVFSLPSPYRTLKIKNSSFITANDDHFLLENIGKLFLLDQQLGIKSEIPWRYDTHWDQFWSSSLDRFILITSKKILTLDISTMMIEPCPIKHNKTMRDWFCGTCFDDTLFLVVDDLGASIYQYNLQPKIELIKEYRSPFTCANDEMIINISSNNQILALAISNRQHQWHLDLCSSTTLGRYHSIKLGSRPTDSSIRCCSFNNDWLVIDAANRQLLYIGTNGKVIKEEKYKAQPTDAAQLLNGMFAIVTDQSVDLYKL